MKRPIIYGLAGSAALLALYFIILSAANSPAHALEQFRDMWYWVLLLSAGFGTQVGLYAHIRTVQRENNSGTAAVAASGGMSSAAMAACCAHHLADLLPLLGLSAAALFLIRYQTFFILAGVASNLIGITMMLRVIQHGGFAGDSRLLCFLVRRDLKEVQRFVIFSSMILLAAVFLISSRAG